MSEYLISLFANFMSKKPQLKELITDTEVEKAKLTNISPPITNSENTAVSSKSFKKFKKKWMHSYIALLISFFSLIVSGGAVLYNLHPFAKPKYICSFQSSFSIGQAWGSLNYYQFVHIENNGYKMGSIEKVVGVIRSADSKHTFEQKIEAKFFLYNNIPYPLFQKYVYPFEYVELQMQMFKEIRDTIILDKINALSDSLDFYKNHGNAFNSPSYKKKADSLISGFVNPQLQFVKKGRYEYAIRVLDSDNNEIVTKFYYFDLNDGHIAAIHNMTANLTDFDLKQKKPAIFIPLYPIKKSQTVSELTKALTY